MPLPHLPPHFLPQGHALAGPQDRPPPYETALSHVAAWPAHELVAGAPQDGAAEPQVSEVAAPQGAAAPQLGAAAPQLGAAAPQLGATAQPAAALPAESQGGVSQNDVPAG